MKTSNRKSLPAIIALLVYLMIGINSNRAYPSWNNDVNDRTITWVGYGSSLFYFAYDELSSSYSLYRWPTDDGNDQFLFRVNDSANPTMMVVHDGALYVTGSGITDAWNDAESVEVHNVIKLDLTTLHLSDPISVNPPCGNVCGLVFDHSGTMYVGGWTTLANTYVTNMFTKWTGSGWVTLGNGICVTNADYNRVRCMVTDGTNIFHSGTFTGFKQANGTTGSALNILSWNVDSNLYAAMGAGLTTDPDEGGQAIVQSLAIAGTNLFATGFFVQNGGMARFSTITRSPLSWGVVGQDEPSEVTTLNGDAYLAGAFESITNGATVSAIRGIARWSNGSWSALGSGINGIARWVTANANSVFGTSLGEFTTAGGLSCSTTARWQLSADEPLRFTSGSLSGNTVTLSLAGIPNLPYLVHRLDFPSDTWVVQGTSVLNSSGTGSFISSVTNGLGYFRAQSVDGGKLSTNAFGSIIASIPSGYWLIGNPFPSLTPSQVFLDPVDGDTMNREISGTLTGVSYSDLDGDWIPSGHQLTMGEGVLVNNVSVNPLNFNVYGLFSTNSFSRTMPTNYSMICSPLYHKLSGGSVTQIDEFNSTRLGGYSLVPVNSSSNPKARANRNKAGVQNQYVDYTLTTGGQWQTNSVNTTVPILLGEGVWFENRSGSNQTWTVSLPIW
jgi:hypothetical protein